MKKQKKMRYVLRCIRIPHEIDHKINQICKDREMNYSQCVKFHTSKRSVICLSLARPVALQPEPVVVRWKSTNKTSTKRITSAVILSVGLVFVRLSRLYASLSAGS